MPLLLPAFVLPLSPPFLPPSLSHHQEDKEVPDLGVLKNVMAHNWVEPSKRERKRVLNYSEADYYKQVMGVCVGGGGGGVSKGGWLQGRGWMVHRGLQPSLCLWYLCPHLTHCVSRGMPWQQPGCLLQTLTYTHTSMHAHPHLQTQQSPPLTSPPPCVLPPPSPHPSGAQDQQG